MKMPPLRRLVLQFWIEALAWPVICVALMQGLVMLGLLDRQGWIDTVTVWKEGVHAVEQRALASMDHVIRDKMDPVLLSAAQRTEARLNKTLEPMAKAVSGHVEVAAAPTHPAGAATPAHPVPHPAQARPTASPHRPAAPAEITLPTYSTRVAEQAGSPTLPGGWELRAF
ncbi:hypothetical protein [Megalodesulfovibrio paquesii]